METGFPIIEMIVHGRSRVLIWDGIAALCLLFCLYVEGGTGKPLYLNHVGTATWCAIRDDKDDAIQITLQYYWRGYAFIEVSRAQE